MSYTNWQSYNENVRERNRATFVFKPCGFMYYIYEGKRIGRRKFESMFPVELIKADNPKGDNPDKTRII